MGKPEEDQKCPAKAKQQIISNSMSEEKHTMKRN